MSDYIQLFLLWILIVHLQFLIQVGNVSVQRWAYNNYSTMMILNSVQLRTFIAHPIYVSSKLRNKVKRGTVLALKKRLII